MECDKVTIRLSPADIMDICGVVMGQITLPEAKIDDLVGKLLAYTVEDAKTVEDMLA